MPESQTIRVYKPDKYTTLYRPMLRDNRLSYGARGLLAFILSFPKGWEIRLPHLIKENPKGRDHVYALLNELKSFRYLVRIRTKVARGRFDWVTIVSETPLEEGFTLDGDEVAPFTGNPYMENPDTENPYTENPYTEKPEIYKLSNKELLNKELLNKELSKTTSSSEPAERTIQPINAADEPVILPDPFPITDEDRAWLTENCPLVDLEAETDNFIIRNNKPPKGDPDGTPPALIAMPLKEWKRRWRAFMRKGQGFAERDAAVAATSQHKPAGNGNATSAARPSKLEANRARINARFNQPEEEKGTESRHGYR